MVSIPARVRLLVFAYDCNLVELVADGGPYFR